MALEDQLAKLIEVNLEIRDLLKAGAGAGTAATTEPKRTRTKTAEKPKPVEPVVEEEDDLTGNTASNPGDDLDDDLSDDDGLGGDDAQYTADQVRETLMTVKTKISKDKALEIMKKQGKAASVAAITAENFDAVMAACEKALAAAK